MSVPPAAQVTETRYPWPRARRPIVTRNRVAPAAPASAPRQPLVVTSTRRPLARITVRRTPPGAPATGQAPRRPLVVTSTRRPLTQVILRRTPPGAAPTVQPARQPLVVTGRPRPPIAQVLLRRSTAAAPVAAPPRPALVVAARAGRPLARAILRRNPLAPATGRPRPIVVARDQQPAARRRPAPLVLRTRPAPIAGPGARARLPLVVLARARAAIRRRPVVLGGGGRGTAQQFTGGLNVLLQIQTLTRVRPAETTDGYGNTVLDYGPAATRTTFEGWIWQANRGETRPDGRNPAEQVWELMCNESDLLTDDRVEWPSGHPSGALTFAIEGPPQPSYRAGGGFGAGGFHHTEASMRLVEG